MPSPFPGMDPFLEDPDVFPDLHSALATAVREALNQTLPPRYYAKVEARPELGITDEVSIGRPVIPDVTVLKSSTSVGPRAPPPAQPPRSSSRRPRLGDARIRSRFATSFAATLTLRYATQSARIGL